MRLIALHIENFGNLSDFDLKFDENPTVILKDNGWGKSTLAAFIKVMFYGFSGENKRTNELKEREKYRPWKGGVYGGRLSYEAGGVPYEITKVFGNKEKEDSCELINLTTGLKVEDLDASHAGLDLFALDERSFMRSVFIAQNDVRVHEDGREGIADGISAKIGKLSDATDDVNRYEAVMDRLNDLLNRMSPKRATGSIKQMSAHISSLQNTLRQEESIKDSAQRLELQLRSEQEKAHQIENERIAMDERFRQDAQRGELLARKEAHEQLWNRYEEAKNSLEELENSYENGLPSEEDVREKLKIWDERNVLCTGLDNKELQLNYLIKDAAEAKVRAEEKHQLYLDEIRWREERTEKIKRSAMILLAIAIVLCVGGAMTVFVLSRITIGAGVIGGGIVSLFAALILMIWAHFSGRKNDEIDDESVIDEAAKRGDEQDIEEMKARIGQDRDRVAIIETNVQEFLRHYRFPYEPEDVSATLYEIRKQIEQLHVKEDDLTQKREELKAFEKANDMTAIMNVPEASDDGEPFDMQKERAENMRRFKVTQDAIRLYVRQLDEYQDQLQNMEEMRSELTGLTKERDDKLHQYEMLTLTRDYLKGAKQNFSAKYRRPLLDGFKKYYSRLSGEEVSEFQLDANIHMTKRAFGEARDVEAYSNGSRDLVDICLRMALVDAMYHDEKPFVILDDPFVNLDENRTKRALTFLKEVASDYQVIYFTCHTSRA